MVWDFNWSGTIGQKRKLENLFTQKPLHFCPGASQARNWRSHQGATIFITETITKC